MTVSDQELVERCRTGRTEDFAELVRRHERPLLAFLNHRLGEPVRAREAAQEAFVRAWTGLRRLEKPGAFLGWLLGIAARIVLEVRRQGRQPCLGPEALDELPAPAAAPPGGDDDLEMAIADLPEGQRQVILLRYFDGLSCQEVAERQGTPLGTVTKTLSRAYAALRERLGDGGGEGGRR